ncbi:MAG: S8 family serine peptidase, partial [Actinomycetota bacterium]
DPRILSVSVNHPLTPAARFITPLSALRPATEPTDLKVANAIDFQQPTLPRLRLRWSPPAKLYGAEIVGYRIQYATGTSKFRNLVSNTESSATKYYLTDGIVAGSNYRFRVRAITSDGNAIAISPASASKSRLVRTTPKPVAITTANRIGPGSVRFVAQSLSDRGGYPLTQLRYFGLATAEGFEPVASSSCSFDRCRFPNLIAGEEYEIEIRARNPLGTTSSNYRIEANDLYYPELWHLGSELGIGISSAWGFSRGSSEVVVAVIDSGIVTHPELDSQLTRNTDGSTFGYDFVSDLDSAADGDGWDSDPTDMGGDVEDGSLSSWHGTHVAGIIAAKSDTEGVVGVAPRTRLLPIRALGRGGGNLGDLLAAINWAAGVPIDGVPSNKFPAKVINLSLGSSEALACPAEAERIIQNILAKGITIVTAAGNDGGTSAGFFPGNCAGVINVAATSSLGDRAAYSNFGSEVTLSAPGGDKVNLDPSTTLTQGMILSTWIGGSGEPYYGLAEGTSMAAPVVSGIVALMYAVNPSITPAKVKDALVRSVRPFLSAGICETQGGCGAGIVNAKMALARAG